ncbi:TetR/AcrR family transcriptional regulator [Nocardia noduli]|uniref:TetR/AcrR family transcriptional regulator n=1 Tax=Nocardia noduli TaxID=2815722 RepID=UPI001C226647|nr:TetR/AcrR family transcriptional regulator [Nocardia noduli]
MGRKGWGGQPPDDDNDARKRILDAALRCIEIHGPANTTLSSIAEELAITRRTVYRYFASTQELFAAAAEVALIGFMAQIEATMRITDVADQITEMVALIIERLPDEPLLALVLANDPADYFGRRILRRDVIVYTRKVLETSEIDWAADGYDRQRLDELAEFLLRTIHSMVVAPAEPPKRDTDLRTYLSRWIGPALRADDNSARKHG